MRQGSFRAVRHVIFLFLILSLTVIPVFGQQKTPDYRSVILESFDGEITHEWSFAGKNYIYDYEWALDASKFATSTRTDSFPRQNYVEAWPLQVYGSNRNGEQNIRSFGIWGRFDRRGYNWIDVYPIVVGSGGDGQLPEPFEIPIPGRIQSMDLWVWGSNLNYTLEAYFRDYNGIVHTVNMGSIAHTGWKNLSARIPNHIMQSKRILPHYAGLTFVKFRIWTMPLERVDNFYIYFNQFKILTDTMEMFYDGDDLGDPDIVQELWAQF